MRLRWSWIRTPHGWIVVFVLTTLHPDGTPFTRGGEHVSVTISGPSSSPIDVPHSVHDNEDGTYTIHILCPRKVNMKFTYNLEN